jgi:hypothetical protein
MRHSIDITLASGLPVTHTADLLGVRHTADGASCVTASCCGLVGAIRTCQCCSGTGCAACGGKGSIKDEDTRSDLAFYDIATLSQDEIMAKIQGHVERVAKHHAGAHKAKEFIASLTLSGAAPGKAG